MNTSVEHMGLGASGPTRMVPAMDLSLLRPAPWNPRKAFVLAALDELAADIKARGILEPLVVRDLVSHHEIVCGERRYHAALRAGLEAVPVVVRELDDRAALEAAVSENGQRESLHPLEEADAFVALRDQYGETPADIAARFGVTEKLVHQRLSLARLCPEGREAFLADKLSWGIALRVARLPLQYQASAVEHLAAPRDTWRGPWTVGEASGWIEQRYHLRLATAPFDTTDATLPGGSCIGCPRNTDAQVPLFGDDVRAAECTDPVCFAQKKETAWQRRAAEVSEGREVLTVEQSKDADAWNPTVPLRGGFARPTDKPQEHGGRKTWAQLLGTKLPQTVIARANDGTPIEVIKPADLKLACTELGLKKLKKADAKPAARDEALDWKTRQELDDKLDEEVRSAALGALSKRSPAIDDRAFWQALTLTVGDTTGGWGDIADRRQLKPAKGKGIRDAWIAEVRALSATGCRAIIVELLVAGPDGAAPLLEWLGVDGVAIEKRLYQEALDAKKAKSKPAAKPTKGKPASTSTKKPSAKKPAAKPAKKGGAR